MRRNAFTILELLIVILIVATLMGLVIPAVLNVRETSARTQTGSFLMQLSLALQNCDNTWRGLPPATGPFGLLAVDATVHIHLLPFIEQDPLLKEIVAGTAPDLKTVVVPPFVCPQDFTQINDGAGATTFATNLRVLSDLGYNTKWDLALAPDQNGNDPKTGKPWYFGTAGISHSFPDGTSNTIAFATRYSRCGTHGGINFFSTSAAVKNNSPFFGYYAPQLEPSTDAGIENGRTGEIFQIQPAMEDCNPSYTPQSLEPHAISVGLFDGSVRMISASISVTTWGRALQPNDGDQLGRDWDR
jgi:type II secretory pathway pseudopilin PulG